MQTRLDLLTRSIPGISSQDTGIKQLPVMGEGENSFGNTPTRVPNEVSAARDTVSDPQLTAATNRESANPYAPAAHTQQNIAAVCWAFLRTEE